MGAFEWNTFVGMEEYGHLIPELALWNFPNPFAASTCITYELQQTSAVQITIYNYQGELIEVIPEKRQVKGNHNLIWQTENLSPGLYYCKLRAGNRVQTLKMIKL
ncbi:MAG: hypothetical protein C0591_05105 [Marinilabiliales bacterium]|nr:MAG: hypothetical protein C0591_05105 [Marinilabiliales bacterium]